MKVAWEVEIRSMSCIVWAETKSKAQYQAVKSYWDAFDQRKGEWPRATAVRRHQYDNSPLANHGKCYSPEHVADFP